MKKKSSSSCSSKTPIVSTSPCKDKRDDYKKKKKLKGVMVVDDHLNSTFHNSSSKNNAFDRMLSKFIEGGKSTTRVVDGAQNDKEEPPTRVYTCNYCKGEFSTSQALGGHQNAHKHERARDKMIQATGLPPYNSVNNLYHPYDFGMYSNIPYGGFYKRSSPLGIVKTNSMIHKPSFNRWPLTQGHMYGYNNVHQSNPSLLVNSQPSYDNQLQMPSQGIMQFSPFNSLNNPSSSLPSFGNDHGNGVQVISRGFANPKVNPIIKSDENDDSMKGDSSLPNGGGKLGQIKLEKPSLDLSLRL